MRQARLVAALLAGFVSVTAAEELPQLLELRFKLRAGVSVGLLPGLSRLE